jgi:hypothetical protein
MDILRVFLADQMECPFASVLYHQYEEDVSFVRIYSASYVDRSAQNPVTQIW